MSAEPYTLDTNVLIYAVDPSEGRKHAIGAQIVDRSVELPCILTMQALAEFVAVATRRRLGSRADAVAQARDWLRLFPTIGADARALDAAYTAVTEGRFALFDALLLTTARQAGCTVALSEDMQDGAALDGIVVRNPFADGGLADDLRPLLGVP
jgi:predicted nucleic acid-binding protein